MQFSFPWILSRKRLVTAVIADGTLFAALYYLLYEFSYDVSPGLSPRLAILLVVWSVISYVIGRYSGGSKSRHKVNGLNLVFKQFISTGIVLLLTLIITFFHFLLFNQNPFQALSRSFLIPFLGSLSILSGLVQLALSRFFLLQKLDRNFVWSYVGAYSDFKRIEDLLKWTRVKVAINHVLPSQIDKVFSSRYVVDRFYDQSPNVLEALYRYQQDGAIVLTRLHWCEAFLQRFPSEFLSTADLLDGRFSIPSGTLQSRLKRIGDFVVALVLLILTSPLILISALFIKLTDRGPIFYSQVRTGLHGHLYSIWKLRTMRIDAEQDGPQWSSRSDSRITKVGSILRLTRLDELPQLWCVLTGSMSLIGPRPERPEFDQRLAQSIPNYHLRNLIRPGLSGWAQVNYPYGASFEDAANKLSYDLFYLKNFSFFLDLLILFKTIRLVFNAQGALPEPSSDS